MYKIIIIYSFFYRVILEHAKGTERGSGGVPHGERRRDSRGGESRGGEFEGSGRKQRARDKYVNLPVMQFLYCNQLKGRRN